MHGIVDFIGLLRAVILRDDDARAGGKARERADEHVDDRCDRADGGERLVADVVADDPCVDGVVQLLENVAGQKRQGKTQKMPEDTALRHVRVVPARRRQIGFLHSHTCFS